MAIAWPQYTRHCSDRGSSGSESGSSFVITTPINTENRSPPPIPNLVHVTPSPGQPQRLGRANRRQHSRLSEVTIPEETDTPIETIDESVTSISPRQMPHSPGRFQNTLLDVEAVDDDTLIPRPLSITQPLLPSRKPSTEALTISTPPRSTSAPNHTACHPKSATKPEVLSQGKYYGGVKSTAQFYGDSAHVRESGAEGVGLTTEHSGPFGEVIGCISTAENGNSLWKLSRGSNSCHPDTWSKDKDEPSDSEPFYPPEYLNSNRCSHESHREEK
jgi:hypothetical protein